jgi:hypothetical protein
MGNSKGSAGYPETGFTVTNPSLLMASREISKKAADLPAYLAKMLVFHGKTFHFI